MDIEQTTSDLKSDKKRAKRTFDVIRSQIQSALAFRPMNTSELCGHTGTSFTTIERHLAYLESIRVINKTLFKLRSGKELALWSVVKSE